MDLKRGVRFGNLSSRRAQVTIFIILGVVIVGGVAAYFVFRNSLPTTTQIPAEFQPLYNTFLSCVQSDTLTGISVLESQGGYIYLPPFEPGSSYQPFSSDLVFLGNPIPYWYYVSENNIPKEQIPNQTFMQNQLAKFVDSKISDCNIVNGSSGFLVKMGSPSSTVKVSSDSVTVNTNMDVTFTKGNQSFTVSKHVVTVNSELGNLFQSAMRVFNYEQSSLFLENYTIDTLMNFAPVDGVNITCSPQTWNATSVLENLKGDITDNIISLTSGANRSDYFNIGLDVQGLHFITDSSWPSDYSVNPTTGDMMIAQPVGNQQGLGILGFCYEAYHFVYSIKYPVLATITSGKETFQFPMAVIIDNNVPRHSLNSTAVQTPLVQLCKQGKSSVTVNVYDTQSAPINANISYECLSQTCDIGQTYQGSFTGNFPQCANGYIIVSSPGYNTGSYLFSTTQSGSINVVLDKLYNETINLEVDGTPYTGRAVINFYASNSNNPSSTVVYPDQKTVNLSEGQYSVQVSAYENTSINVGATAGQECVNVPTGIGIGAALGNTQQQCFTVNTPAQIISDALSAGGQQNYYFTDSALSNSNTITIDTPSLPVPRNLTQLQTNYVLAENKNLSISV